jgi:invasion protein IalB
MNPTRHLILSVAIGLALAAPGHAQEAASPAEPAAPAADAAPAAPAEAAPADPAAPAAEPAAPAEAPAVAPAEAPAEAAPATPAQAPAAGAPAAAPEQEITVTKQGDWEIGCVAGTTNCEMQQVALDETDNPVVLVRVVRLPEAADAEALMIFNTPLGTLLPTGLGFRIDSAEGAALPFEWCVQEGCIVRLGLRDAEIAAMKRGKIVKLTVSSIADPNAPVELDLSLTGFTAAYGSLTAPTAPPAPPAQQ